MQGSKEMWRLVSCSLFLLLLCGLDALICKDKFIYSGLRGRSKIPPLVSTTARDKGECALLCAQLAACNAFSFSGGSEGCSLFPRRIMAVDVDLSVPSEDAHFPRMFDSCPTANGYEILPGTTKCIRVGFIIETLPGAEGKCGEDGGHLIIIENGDILQKLLAFIPTGFYHVGFHDLDTEDVHLWLDGTPVNRSWFKIDEPNDHPRYHYDQDCGLLDNPDGLADTRCSTRTRYVCSIPVEE